ncbi:MAG: divergent PAP2 family protein [Treponema sp.]|nr:divergent PAP2 family protein [Treponema sp.]
MWEQIKLFFSSPVFLAGVTSWFLAQFIKTVINLIYGKVHSFVDLVSLLVWKTGGLPSSHTALVTSVCTTVGFRSGITSDLFMLCVCFLMVTVRDAVGVRLSSGRTAQKMNKVGRELKENEVISEYEPVKEVNGHTPLEVLLGFLLGLFIGVAYSSL